MKIILVPCDFSPTTEKAVKFAIDLADKGDRLILLNIINDNATSKKIAQDLKEVETKFKKLIDLRLPKGIAVCSKTIPGKFISSILNLIENEKIDLVVMGTQGSRGWGEFFMGSNIEKVVRTSPVPVFAVKGFADFDSINNIIFPCNLNLDQPEILQKVKELQKRFHSRLHLLRVNTGKSLNDIKIIENLEEYARHYQLSDYSVAVINNTSIKDGILHFAKEISADMIAMITHGKRDLHRMFTESTTADIVNHARILVWTCTS